MATEDDFKGFYSERNRRGPVLHPLSEQDFIALVISVFDRVQARGDFQEAFGYFCIDDDDIKGSTGPNYDAFFLRKIRRRNIWPYRETICDDFIGEIESWQMWDDDTTLDVIELIYTLVSRGVSGRNHTYGRCGWHYDNFEKAPAQNEYREEINEVLRLHDPPLQLIENGNIVEIGPVHMRPLMSTPVPKNASLENKNKIDNAVNLFRKHNATLDDKRYAIMDLAGVLENMKQDVKKHLLNKDNSNIFDIANNFAIRHNNPNQQTKYDKEIWLPWIFYYYLATIYAVLEVVNKQNLLNSLSDDLPYS
jgi:hypothetical protein